MTVTSAAEITGGGCGALVAVVSVVAAAVVVVSGRLTIDCLFLPPGHNSNAANASTSSTRNPAK